MCRRQVTSCRSGMRDMSRRGDGHGGHRHFTLEMNEESDYRILDRKNTRALTWHASQERFLGQDRPSFLRDREGHLRVSKLQCRVSPLIWKLLAGASVVGLFYKRSVWSDFFRCGDWAMSSRSPRARF